MKRPGRSLLIACASFAVVTGCGSEPGTPAEPPASPAGTTVSPAALGLVHEACTGPIPDAVLDVFPEAEAFQRDEAPGGPNCVWHVEGQRADNRALLMASRHGSVEDWRKLNGGPTEDRVVADRPVVLEKLPATCTVLFELGGTAVSADFTGVQDTDCGHAIALVEELLSKR